MYTIAVVAAAAVQVLEKFADFYIFELKKERKKNSRTNPVEILLLSLFVCIYTSIGLLKHKTPITVWLIACNAVNFFNRRSENHLASVIDLSTAHRAIRINCNQKESIEMLKQRVCMCGPVPATKIILKPTKS